MWLIVYVCCVEKRLKACWIVVDVTSCFWGCELCDVMKMVISSLFVWTCHLHYSEALVVTSVMCIEKEWVLKRMYHFEGRIARCDGYYISRDVSRAAMVTIIEDRVVCRDRCIDRYVPMGPALRDSECVSLGQTCIIILDIALHCTYLSLVKLISCFVDLLIAFLRNLWLINIELVIADM